MVHYLVKEFIKTRTKEGQHSEKALLADLRTSPCSQTDTMTKWSDKNTLNVVHIPPDPIMSAQRPEMKKWSDKATPIPSKYPKISSSICSLIEKI